MTRTVLPIDEGRVDVLVAKLLEFSRARVRGLVAHGGIAINGELCTDAGAKLAADDVVTLTFDPKRQYREPPAERATKGFRLLFVDEYLAVVDKDAGILTVPTGRGEGQTLSDLLAHHLAKGQGRRRPVSVVHRLDRETSGVLVFGRNPKVAKTISDQFAAHKPERIYVVLVAGLVTQDKGTIRSHLATDKSLNQKSVRPGDKGELAITHYEVVARYEDVTRLQVRLETGRRNQIRVHVSEMGHPVLGDERYMPETAAHSAWPYKRLALHAHVLGFRHPVTGKQVKFEAPIPREFGAFK